MSLRRLLLACALPALAGGAAAQDAATIAAERQRIGEERARAEAAFAAAEKACYQRFAVNDCIDDARVRRREVLADLRRQEVTLNDIERKRRTDARLREIEARQAEQERDARERRAAAAAAPQRPASAPAPRAAASAPLPAAPSAAPATAGPTEAQRQENMRRNAERVRDAEERKAKAAQRAAERTKKRSDPLPVPN